MNKTCLILLCIVLITISCRQEHKYNILDKLSDNVSVVDYNTDTILYKLKLSETGEPSIFMVVKGVYVRGLYFGNYNKKNWDSAYSYVKRNRLWYPVLKHDIYVLTRDNKFRKLWYIDDVIIEGTYYIVLEAGEADPVEADNIHGRYVRIILRDNTGIGFYSLNFSIDENYKWRLVSKETLDKEQSTETRSFYNTYCIDTTSKNLNTHANYDTERISFEDLLPEHPKTWECYH